MNAERLRQQAFNIAEVRRLAKQRLPCMLFDFTDGAAEDEISMQRNTSDFARYELLPRMLAGALQRDQSIELFGERLSLPVIVPPTGLSGMLWPRGEEHVARACHAAGTLMCVSHGSTVSLEDIARASTGPLWFQVFPYRDRKITEGLVQRAKEAGYKALVLTVDCQTHGQRERDLRNGFVVPPRVSLKNGLDTLLRLGWLWQMRQTPTINFKNYEPYFQDSGLMSLSAYMATIVDPDVGWDTVDWLRELWQGPLLLKGILHPDDARLAIEHGVDGIFVSNHGGRQLDSVQSSIAALPAIAEAVDKRMKILIDGGIRRGTDVLKALALGADAVAIGRPQLWGLAIGGQAGVEQVLDIFRREIDRALVLGGWDSVQRLDARCLQAYPSSIES